MPADPAPVAVLHHRDCAARRPDGDQRCTCGASAPRDPEFDATVDRMRGLRRLMQRQAPWER